VPQHAVAPASDRSAVKKPIRTVDEPSYSLTPAHVVKGSWMKAAAGIGVAGSAQLLPGVLRTPPARSNAGASGGTVPAVPAERTSGGPQMARQVTVAGLRQAGLTAEQVQLLVLASGFDNGDEWRLAPFHLARACGAVRATVLGVQQMSCGGAAGIEHVVARMTADITLEHAVVVAGDSFADLPAEHWTSATGEGVALEDGAAAVVLSRVVPGRFHIRSVTSCGASVVSLPPGLAAAGAGNAGSAAGDTVKQHLVHAWEMRRLISTVIRQALEDIGTEADDPAIADVRLPRLGQPFLRAAVLPALPPPLRVKVSTAGQDTGHLGSGDLLADLTTLHAEASAGLPAAPVSLLLSLGTGMTASCVVVHDTGPLRPPPRS
jgi:3-oxoacyl-[acyl-carrier-protein] synthase III